MGKAYLKEPVIVKLLCPVKASENLKLRGRMIVGNLAARYQ
jgi:hypothetical protein